MLEFFKKLFKKTVPEKAPANPLLAALAKGKCPDCGGTEFFMGPHGGACQNVKCAGCGSKFNLCPFDDEWIGTPLMADRITS